MLKGRMSSRNFFGRIGLFLVISAMFLTITAAGANAAGFSFVDSVVEFFGFAPTQTTAPIVQTAEPISAQPMAPQALAVTTVFSDDFSTNTSATYTNSGAIGAS